MDDRRWTAETVFEQLATASLLVDDICLVVAANAAAAALFSVDGADLVGTPFGDWWQRADEARLHRAATSVVHSPGRRVVLEKVPLIVGDGDPPLVTVAMTGLEADGESFVLCELIPPLD